MLPDHPTFAAPDSHGPYVALHFLASRTPREFPRDFLTSSLPHPHITRIASGTATPITIIGAPNIRVIAFARATLFVILLPAAYSLPRLASVCAGLMARTMEQMEQLVGHALSQVDIVEKAANDQVDAKQNATAQLVQALLTQVQTLQARVAELEQTRGSTGASKRPATLEEIVERRSQLQRIKEADLSAGEARAAGYTCADAKAVGYTLLEAKAAGWSSDELRMVGYVDSKGMSSREFFDRYQAGCTNFSGLDFSGEDFSRMVLDKPCSFAGCNLSDTTFDHATLFGIDFSSSRMSRVDISRANVQKCKFGGCVMD
eukprot:85377-Prymnesium_polylepis.1